MDSCLRSPLAAAALPEVSGVARDHRRDDGVLPRLLDPPEGRHRRRRPDLPALVSGFLQALSSLPQFLQDAAPWLPTYHFGRLVWSQIAPAADVASLTGRPMDSLTVHVVWVLGTFLAFGALAVAGYLRDGRRERA